MLIRELTAEHIYLACGHTDMRKSIDGLAALVVSQFHLASHLTIELEHSPDVHGQREDPHRDRVHPRQGQGHRLLPRILPVPRLPQGSAFLHREAGHAAARHRQVHRLTVERRACHGAEVPAVHAALSTGTRMERDWHPTFACNAGQLGHPAR